MTKEEAIQKESERRYPLDSCTDLPHPFAYEKAEDILDKRVLFREGAKWAMEEYREQREQVQWEYNHCYIGGANLGELGNEGWELCAIYDEKMYILKRPKLFKPEPPKD